MIQSATFWLILLLSVVLFWILPLRARYWFLGGASYCYLITLDPVAVTVLIFWGLLFFYVAPQALADRRYSPLVVIGLIVVIAGYLIYEKYWPTIAFQLHLQGGEHPVLVPLGISYFTFKLIHYAVEVGRGNITDRSLSKFFSYLFLFPIFTAGPIERFDHFTANLEERWKLEFAVEGLTRIVHGLIKIFVFAQVVHVGAEKLGVPISHAKLLGGLAEASVFEVWGFAVTAYLYAYLDFSAYSDIAIGASRLFGIRIMENFRFPILARNISDFWKRWHMTLAGWCQSYVYMPIIGRTRNPYLAVYGTFLIMGIWHGATAGWVMWGLYHATGVAGYLTWTRVKRTRFPALQARNPKVLELAGLPLTFLFVSGSYAFSSTGGGGGDAVRVFLKLWGVNLGE